MKKVILCINNQPYVAQAFFNQFENTPGINIIQNHADKISDYNLAFAQWKTYIDDTEINNYISNADISDTDINIAYITYDALLYLIAKDRKEQNKDISYCIASVVEPYKTKVISSHLYNFYIDSKFKAGIGLFKDFFDENTDNELLLADFDILYADAKSLGSQLLADDIINYLSN